MAQLMKNLKKQTVRAKESLLVSLGKSDRTTDEQFEEHVIDFGKQQKNGERLQKELKSYVACLKALNQASKGFYDAVREVYEPQWDDVEHVKAITHSLELLWDDYMDKMNDQALNSLNTYCNQFGEIKAKIDKRRRKLVDYDSARHNYDSVQAGGKKDDKLQKAQEHLNETKKLYEDLNRELMTELPELYEARIGFTVNHFQTIFNAEHTFHEETGKLSKELSDKIGKVKITTPQKRNSLPRPPPITKPTNPPPSLPQTNSNHDINTKVSPETDKRASAVTQPGHPPSPKEEIKEQPKPKSEEKITLYPSISIEKTQDHLTDNNPFGEDDEEDEQHHIIDTKKKPDENGIAKVAEITASPPPYEPHAPPKEPKRESKLHQIESKIESKFHEIEKKVVEAVIEKEKPQEKKEVVVLYKVRATHRYVAEDTDELSFEAGDIINVVPFDDPEEQDEGWLTGVKETTGAKGVFPANFTKEF